MKRKGDSLSALSSLGLIVLKDDIVNFMKYPAISQITCLQKKALVWTASLKSMSLFSRTSENE